MTNAKEEFLHCTEKHARVKCAHISLEDYGEELTTHDSTIVLKLNYSEQDFKDFLNKLDFHYDKGYGIQHVYGTVWLEDGTWLSRGEYDGSEWWQHNVCPEINEECKV